MYSKYLFSFIWVILQSSAKENYINYIVNNELGTNDQISTNYVTQRSLQSPFDELFQKYMQPNPERVEIQLYYECMCPDCRQFDTTQFKEAVIKLDSNLDVRVYPYGNAQTIEQNGRIEFICQHGPAECYGNKLHACAIDYLNNTKMAVCFNSCMMDSSQAGRGSDDAAADVCGHSMGINPEPIKMCAKTNRGTQLLKYYGEESKKANFNSVPHILINGVENSGDNFMRDVCKAFKNPPPACNELLLN